MLSGHWGDQMLFSAAYLIDLLRRGAWPPIWRHTREYARYFGNSGDLASPPPAARRRRALSRAAARRAAAEVAAPATVRPPQAEDLVRAVVSQRRIAVIATGSRPSNGPFHSAHAQAVYIEARSKYQVQCMEWNAKVGARYGLERGVSVSRSRPHRLHDVHPGDIHAHDGVPRALLRAGDARRAARFDSRADVEIGFQPLRQQGISDDAGEILRTLTTDCLGVRFGYPRRRQARTGAARLAGSTERAPTAR